MGGKSLKLLRILETFAADEGHVIKSKAPEQLHGPLFCWLNIWLDRHYSKNKKRFLTGKGFISNMYLKYHEKKYWFCSKVSPVTEILLCMTLLGGGSGPG